MKKIVIAILILLTTFSYSQNSQKKYKYILVPLQYGFTSEPNQFQLNVLTRVMLKEEGFEVYMSEGEKKPREVTENQCLALKADVIKDGGLFTTKLIFRLKDCFGKLVYESSGTSREKAFKDAYQEALRDALEDFQVVSASYLKINNVEEQEQSTVKIVDTSKEEVQNLAFEDQADAYTYNNNTFWLLKKDNNYILYQDKGNTVLATLEMADRGTFAYDSADIDGAAYFNANGDIIVEYLAKNKDAVQKLVYTKQ